MLPIDPRKPGLIVYIGGDAGLGRLIWRRICGTVLTFLLVVATWSVFS